MKRRLDEEMLERGMVFSRSQAQRLIKLGKVNADGRTVKKQHYMVAPDSAINIVGGEKYVSRAGFKLASVAESFNLDFKNKVVLDVGSSTGGFTDFALQQGAKKVIAVDVGSKQLHPSLIGHSKIELYEQTDIRNVLLAADIPEETENRKQKTGTAILRLAEETVNSKRETEGEGQVFINEVPDIVVVDVSFISLREVLPHVAKLCGPNTQIVAMLKPQFEAGNKSKNKGVIKNNTLRRKILKDFEQWAKRQFAVQSKKDSEVAGQKGNVERFYLMTLLSRK